MGRPGAFLLASIGNRLWIVVRVNYAAGLVLPSVKRFKTTFK
jgi:hypothetical protein